MTERRRYARKALLVLALLGLLPGCEELPGEEVRGVIEAPEPWIVPTLGRPVCISVLEVYQLYQNSAKAHSSFTRSTPRFAAGASLVLPDGTRLRLEGKADGIRLDRSEEVWAWSKKKGGRRPREFSAEIHAPIGASGTPRTRASAAARPGSS